MPGAVLHELKDLWVARRRCDEFFGTLVNAYIIDGGEAVGIKAGEAYVDVGTFDGYRGAMALLRERALAGQAGPLAAAGIATAAGAHLMDTAASKQRI